MSDCGTEMSACPKLLFKGVRQGGPPEREADSFERKMASPRYWRPSNHSKKKEMWGGGDRLLLQIGGVAKKSKTSLRRLDAPGVSSAKERQITKGGISDRSKEGRGGRRKCRQ